MKRRVVILAKDLEARADELKQALADDRIDVYVPRHQHSRGHIVRQGHPEEIDTSEPYSGRLGYEK